MSAFLIRKEPKGHGRGLWIEGLVNLPRGSAVAIVEDVANTGMSLKAALELLRKARTDWGITIEIAGIFLVLTEGYTWRDALGEAR